MVFSRIVRFTADLACGSSGLEAITGRNAMTFIWVKHSSARSCPRRHLDQGHCCADAKAPMEYLLRRLAVSHSYSVSCASFASQLLASLEHLALLHVPWLFHAQLPIDARVQPPAVRRGESSARTSLVSGRPQIIMVSFQAMISSNAAHQGRCCWFLPVTSGGGAFPHFTQCL